MKQFSLRPKKPINVCELIRVEATLGQEKVNLILVGTFFGRKVYFESTGDSTCDEHRMQIMREELYAATQRVSQAIRDSPTGDHSHESL